MGLLYPIFPARAPSTRLGSYMPSCERLHGVSEKSLNWILASPRAGCETWRELVEFASHKMELVIPSSQSCWEETEVVGVPHQTRNGRSSVAWQQYLSVRMRRDVPSCVRCVQSPKFGGWKSADFKRCLSEPREEGCGNTFPWAPVPWGTDSTRLRWLGPGALLPTSSAAPLTCPS